MLGFYNVIKPTGMNSSTVVSIVKRASQQKAGHLGTLDPMASGVLPIAVGKATRFFDYFLKKEKEYIALAKFGVLTDTLDSDGKILATDNKDITIGDIQSVLHEFKEYDQVPPMYSRKSVDGVRAYEAARKNIDIKLASKKVQISGLKAEKSFKNNVFKLKINCVAGTYVRSLIRDIAKKLGTIAIAPLIIRTRSGPFNIDNSCTIEEIKNGTAKLIKINEVLNLKEVRLDYNQAKTLIDGKTLNIDLVNGQYLAFYNGSEFSVVEVLENLAKNKIYLYSEENL